MISDEAIAEAVATFWSGRIQGTQTAVHDRAFLELIAGDLTAKGYAPHVAQGISDAAARIGGYFRASKSWDIVCRDDEGRLSVAIEFKSQVDSYGNNENNRYEEALGSGLDARARYGHADLSWECLYYRPPFPRGVISSGPVDLEGSQVLGLVPEAAYAGQWSLVPNSERTPSHVFANGTGPGALRLGPRTEVSGNAATCGGLDLDPAAQVGGEVQAHAAPQEVPAFDIPEMITRVGSAAGLHPFHPALPVNDFMTALSIVNVNHDLVLDGGTLAVRGNLTVQGAVRGRGVLLVDGNVTLRGGSSFEADRQVALLATGNVDLVGPGQDYYFQGLLYSQGQLTARQLSVLGSVVCNSSNPAHRVELENVRLITTPIHVQTRYGMPTIESVADDTIRFYLSCTPDPLRPDQMLFYGKGDYCEAYDYDTSREPVHLRVYFNPGEAVWTVDGNIVDRHPYDGKRASIEAELGRLITYYGENAGGAPGRVSRYLDALVAGSQQDQYLEINLNQVIRPVERARILYWGPLRQH